MLNIFGSEFSEPGQLTTTNWPQTNWPRKNGLVTDFVTVILSQSEGLGKMALGIVKYAYDRSSQPIGIIWFAVSLSRSVVVDPNLVLSSVPCNMRQLDLIILLQVVYSKLNWSNLY